MWRTHQQQFLDLCHAIAQGQSKARHIIASVTPGGGKSALPVIAASVLIPVLCDRICWVVPRSALQRQGKEAFDSPIFRQLLGRNMRVRVAGNGEEPSRNASGYTITYQALAADKKGVHRREFERYRYCLVLDEPHHAPEDSEWAEVLAPLVKRSTLLIQMSGTFQRHDNKAVAFLPYAQTQRQQIFDISQIDRPDVAAIAYPRAQALAEGSVIPLEVRWFDLSTSWEKDGEQKSLLSLSEVESRDVAEALYVALRTGAAKGILRACYQDWLGYRQRNPRSKLLVVAPTVELAEVYLKDLESAGADRCGIAVSKDSAAAHKAISQFKSHGEDGLDILCTVAMAYEGLDVPSCTHIACLTNIRSGPWIEQMATRATRVDLGPGAMPPHEQAAYLYCPDDVLMRQCVETIVEQEACYAAPPKDDFRLVQERISEPVDPEAGPKIKPLDGSALLSGFSNLEGDSLTAAEVSRLPMLARITGAGEAELRSLPVATLKGQLRMYAPMIQAMAGDAIARPVEVSAPRQPTPDEEKLRRQITAATKRIDAAKGWPPGTVNGMIVRQFRCRRADMSAEQLSRVLRWLNEDFSVVV
ncbi:MAG TPA: DEAD/DEAH box helicase family protein [Trichocoleus sp.]